MVMDEAVSTAHGHFGHRTFRSIGQECSPVRVQGKVTSISAHDL
jgi:hypothetical protein